MCDNNFVSFYNYYCAVALRGGQGDKKFAYNATE